MVTLAGFITFIQSNMQIPVAALPTTSPDILTALAIAESIVNPDLMQIGRLPGSVLGYTGNGIYEFAVYNLAGDNLINFANDQSGQTYFANARTQFGINSFVAGVIASTADQATSESLATPDSLKQLTLQNLQNLKTPWGRTYLQYAQMAGTLWGMS